MRGRDLLPSHHFCRRTKEAVRTSEETTRLSDPMALFLFQKRLSVDCFCERAGTLGSASRNALGRLPFEVFVRNDNQMCGSFFNFHVRRSHFCAQNDSQPTNPSATPTQQLPGAASAPQDTQPGQTSQENQDQSNGASRKTGYFSHGLISWHWKTPPRCRP